MTAQYHDAHTERQHVSKQPVQCRRHARANANGKRDLPGNNIISIFAVVGWLRHRLPNPHRQLILILSIAMLLMELSVATTSVAIAGSCRDEESRSCESICQGGGDECVIRALVLLPDNDMYVASLRRVLPILRVAEEKLWERQLLPRHIRFDWMPQDDKCDAAYAVIKAMDGIVKNCAHVVFGPICDYPLAAVSRITKYFNSHGTPLISVGGSTYDFEKKKTSCSDEFYMLLRTGMLSFETISDLTISLMKRFNWSRSVFFYDRDGQRNVAGLHTCYLMMNSLGKQMRKENMTFAQFPIDPKTLNRTDEMKREIGNKHNIVIMCADPQSIRQIMLTAEELNMIDSGEYVFINVELFARVPFHTSKPWYDANDTEENNRKAKKAYTAILTVTPNQPHDDEYLRISNEIKEIAAAKYNYTFQPDEPISAFVTSFFDGVLLYANALNDSIREDPTVLQRPINGSDMVRRMWNRSFMGITGNVTIDSNGDRISAYSLLDLNPATGYFEVVATFMNNHLAYETNKGIHWAGGRTEPPPDRPICGYDGSLCPDNSLPGYAILSIVLGVLVVIMSVGFFCGYRHYKAEAEINSMAWRVTIDEVLFHNGGGRFQRGSMHSLVKKNSQVTLLSEDGSFSGDRQIFVPVGMFRGCKVAVKAIDKHSISLTRDLMLELKRMKDLQHDHLVKFYGACLDPPKSFLLAEYCQKGSLQDILENEQFQLDWMFKFSLMHDIVRGMQFLHSSDIKSHGNLKSSNCVVDSRFVLKIGDFGLHSLRRSRYEGNGDDVENCQSHAYWSKLLWTAPELLRLEECRPLEGTQKGDVYSFGIIVHEITTRQGPFYLGHEQDEKTPQEIVQLVKAYPAEELRSPFRPQMMGFEMNSDLTNMMTKCWSEDPNERPDFNALKTIIRKINKDNETGNIVDNLLKRMEQYANNLEELVEERTQDYLEEKKKCEKLLYQLLPQSVAAQLICGQPVVAETFDQVTIYFSDIVGFTAISAESTPMQVVQFLNDLYTCFDSIVENFDVYKVETIGDAYMVVSGLPIRNGNQHAREIARLALALLQAVHTFQIHHRPHDRLRLRIGLHTGPCVAGVVGLKMPRYCLFGDTVNTASRMESNGEALKIHISETTKLALDEFGTFVTTRRGYVPMKGKGEMLTYWLEGEIPKPESPRIPNKMLLSRRSSLKQPQLRGVQKSLTEFTPFPQLLHQHLHYHQQQPELTVLDTISKDVAVESEKTPNLRVKRKISASSPRLNGGVADAMETAGDLIQNGEVELSDRANEMTVKDPIGELANFRLPLSGALKSHQHLLANSNCNLSGILQPNTKMIRSKLTDSFDNASVHSGNHIKFKDPPAAVDHDDDERFRHLPELNDSRMPLLVLSNSSSNSNSNTNNNNILNSNSSNNSTCLSHLVKVNNAKNLQVPGNGSGNGGVAQPLLAGEINS